MTSLLLLFKMASVQAKAMCVLWFFETNSVITTQRRYRARYGKDPPSDNAIRRWLKQFQQTGSVLQQKGAGRPGTKQENVDRIWEAFIRSPQKSTRRASLQLNIPHMTIWRVLRNRLHLHAYKLQIVQALKPNDKPKRFQFAQNILSSVEVDENYLRRYIFSDEATFYVSGKVNRHNCRIWGSENPHGIREYERDSPKVNVWCALSCSEVFGPFFFVEQTVTAVTYLDMLQLYLLPQLEDHQPNVMFQQDGAPPHWALIVREFLDTHFPGRWVGRGGPIQWPPRSPDLTPLDFFLWGYVKDIVYSTPVMSLDELKRRIVAAIKTVTPQMLENCWKEIENRLDIVRVTKGAHVEVI